jgi:hypothetical protein
MGARNAEDIQREIERARVSLADTVDQLTYRTSPKRLAERGQALIGEGKTVVQAQLKTQQGKAVAGAIGGLVVLVLLRKIFKR